MRSRPSSVAAAGIAARRQERITRQLAAVKALPKLGPWFGPESAVLDVDGASIVSFGSVTPSALTLVQGTTLKRAQYVPAAMNGRAAAVFTRGEVDHYRMSAPIDMSGNVATLTVWRSLLGGQAQGIVSSLDSINAKFGFHVTAIAGQGQAYLGPAPATINFLNTPGKLVATVMEKTATHFRIRHDGVQSGWVAHANATGTDVFTVGAIDQDNSAGAMELGGLFVFPADTILDDLTTMKVAADYLGDTFAIAL